MAQGKTAFSAQELSAAVQIADREQAAGNFEAAAAIYKLVLTEIPDYVDGQAKLARALFCLRRWDEAWRAFDMRFKLMDVPPKVTLRNPETGPRELPRYARGPLPKKLLVMSEQGMGDTIQFARFLPKLVEKGIDVQAVVPQRLIGLLRTLDPCPVLLAGEMPGSLAQVENWATMMDLPELLRLKEEDYLAAEPYLSADPARVERWRDWLDQFEGPAVAFAWRGNPEHKLDGSRSAQLEDFAPLAQIPGVTLICLQMNATDAEIAACGFGDKVVRPGPDFDSGPDAFADTAAILACVDRLVCVDTSLVHVAGALHCPVDVLLAKDWADWRWLDVEDMNVWYPTMTLRRRRAGDDWRDVVVRIANDIAPGCVAAAERRAIAAPMSAADLLERIATLDAQVRALPDGEARVRRKAERDALKAALAGSDLFLQDLRAQRSALEDAVREMVDAQAAMGREETTESLAEAARRYSAAAARRDDIKRRIDDAARAVRAQAAE